MLKKFKAEIRHTFEIIYETEKIIEKEARKVLLEEWETIQKELLERVYARIEDDEDDV